jgi:hypothetical protein
MALRLFQAGCAYQTVLLVFHKASLMCYFSIVPTLTYSCYNVEVFARKACQRCFQYRFPPRFARRATLGISNHHDATVLFSICTPYCVTTIYTSLPLALFLFVKYTIPLIEI